MNYKYIIAIIIVLVLILAVAFVAWPKVRGYLFKYKYVGCYGDLSQSDIPEYARGMDVNQCYLAAKAKGAKYFAIQNWLGDQGGSCMIGNAYGKEGVSTAPCVKDPLGNIVGGPVQNAVYEIL
jgi:hypothetical protein